tara:strand:- start:6325 stop:6579 length:255 start_codon:yes stop_codon:yes gene_type:complete
MTTIIIKKKKARKGPPADDAPVTEKVAYWDERFRQCYGTEVAVSEGTAKEQQRWPDHKRAEIDQMCKELDIQHHDEDGNVLTLA